jgi:hypothetical protein
VLMHKWTKLNISRRQRRNKMPKRFVFDEIGQELARYAEAEYQKQRHLSHGYCCVANSPSIFLVFMAARNDKTL